MYVFSGTTFILDDSQHPSTLAIYSATVELSRTSLLTAHAVVEATQQLDIAGSVITADALLGRPGVGCSDPLLISCDPASPHYPLAPSGDFPLSLTVFLTSGGGMSVTEDTTITGATVAMCAVDGTLMFDGTISTAGLGCTAGLGLGNATSNLGGYLSMIHPDNLE